MPKSYWWGGWVAHVILVSAQGPNPSFFLFWGTFIQLGGLLGQEPGLVLGPGLDNFFLKIYDTRTSGATSIISFVPFLHPSVMI